MLWADPHLRIRALADRRACERMIHELDICFY